MRTISILFIVLLVQFAASAQNDSDSFIRGADLSSVPRIEDHGGTYTYNGKTGDVLDILKENGLNYVRLRIWHSPSDGYCGLAKTLAFAKRIKAKGLKFLLDFHYSDTWADPGHQDPPAVWANLDLAGMKDSVYSYTKYVITALKNEGALPDMVQIGNEVTGGMLWPVGKISTSGWGSFIQLLKAGIQGVKDAADPDSVKIMIHIDRGGNNNLCRYFFDNLIAQGVNFDVIGLSYYPWYTSHGTLSQLQSNLNDLADRYQKDIVIAESAFPWTTSYANDGTGNVGFDPSNLPAGYPVNPHGQRDFITYLKRLLKNTDNNKGIGFFYWEAAWIPAPGAGSSWENYTTFDFSGNALSSIQMFQSTDSLKTINVTLRANTATIADSLRSSGVLQVRGEVKGTGAGFLPSGERISWGSDSQIKLINSGGDYWEYTFKMYPADQLQFLFWSGFSLSKPTQPNFGNETPVIPYDSSNSSYRLFTAGVTDTVLDLQYVNSSPEHRVQYWSPFRNTKDSVGVFFKVNLSKLIYNGLFDSTKNGPVLVRGDSVSSAGVLTWSSNQNILHKQNIVGGKGSSWIGVVYFPKDKIAHGTKINYKFFIDNSGFGGEESAVAERSFSFPDADTTLPWVYFNNNITITGIQSDQNRKPLDFKLYQNYPNPFNPSTVIGYNLPESGRVILKIYDALGNEVTTLLDKIETAGEHRINFNSQLPNGNKISSGVYFISLKAGTRTEVKKMVLMK